MKSTSETLDRTDLNGKLKTDIQITKIQQSSFEISRLNTFANLDISLGICSKFPTGIFLQLISKTQNQYNPG